MLKGDALLDAPTLTRSSVNDDREAARLAAVYRSALLDTPPEPEFDELVELAAAICGAPMSVVSLVDTDRVWHKAMLGFDLEQAPRKISFCTHAIEQDNLFLVEDATADPRFSENPFVTPEDGVRFYAGMPVQSPDGYSLGTLCVFDTTPRTLSDQQRAALTKLAHQVNARIELRMQRVQLERALVEAEDARKRLAASDRRFKTFMDSGPFLGFLKDPEGRFLIYNQPFADRFNITLKEWIGKRVEDLFPPEFAKSYRSNDLEVLRSFDTVAAIEHTQNPDGSLTTWRSFKFPCVEPDGAVLLGGISLDVTQELARESELIKSKEKLEEANKLLHELAATDSLTGLVNRRIFEERLQLEFARSRRKRLALSVLVIDVDNFKRRNDTWGHDHGDEILRQLAKILNDTVRESDLAARYGGEEFVVLLPEADEAQALSMADRILTAVREAQWPNGALTVSIGASAMDKATPNPQRLVTLADEALYAAKRSGKDRAVGYRVYYADMLARLQNAAPPSEAV